VAAAVVGFVTLCGRSKIAGGSIKQQRCGDARFFRLKQHAGRAGNRRKSLEATIALATSPRGINDASLHLEGAFGQSRDDEVLHFGELQRADQLRDTGHQGCCAVDAWLAGEDEIKWVISCPDPADRRYRPASGGQYVAAGENAIGEVPGLIVANGALLVRL